MLGCTMSPAKIGSLVAQAQRAAAPWIALDHREVKASYNVRPFLVHHRLAEHPMFEIDALTALCRRLPRTQVHHRVGVVPADADFDASFENHRGGLTLDAAIAELEARQAYIAIYNAETDPEYRPVIEGLLGEIAAHTEPLDPGLNWYSTYVFISARDAVTPYHMDREMNFLLQIRGTKTVQLWDPNDPDVMTPAQKDALLSERDDPRPTYRPAFAHKAMTFELAPGLGVHHPFIAPHLVKTGKALSISLAITFRTRQSDIWTDAHYFNYRLRNRFGVALGDVGKHGVVDATKARLIRMRRQARRLLGDQRSA